LKSVKFDLNVSIEYNTKYIDTLIIGYTYTHARAYTHVRAHTRTHALTHTYTHIYFLYLHIEQFTLQTLIQIYYISR